MYVKHWGKQRLHSCLQGVSEPVGQIRQKQRQNEQTDNSYNKSIIKAWEAPWVFRAVVPKLICMLESPDDLVELPKPRTYLRLTAISGMGPRPQEVVKLPRWFQWADMFGNHWYRAERGVLFHWKMSEVFGAEPHNHAAQSGVPESLLEKQKLRVHLRPMESGSAFNRVLRRFHIQHSLKSTAKQ